VLKEWLVAHQKMVEAMRRLGNFAAAQMAGGGLLSEGGS
jgi:hypothetical protein